MIVSITVKTIESSMDVANGKIQVNPFPWIVISPGSLPNGKFIRDANNINPPITRKIAPIIRNILASVGSILLFSALLQGSTL